MERKFKPPETATGVDESFVAPAPNFELLLPQQYAWPPSVTPHAYWLPRDTALKVCPPTTACGAETNTLP